MLFAFYSLTLFISAFLLFLIQPIISKYLLPFFGGSSSVWNICMFFFTSFLLLGYIYSHALIKKITSKYQLFIHVGLLTFGLIFLIFHNNIYGNPILPNQQINNIDILSPNSELIKILIFYIGLPYFILATTSPLLQSWYSKMNKPVYNLYAFSNFGSLLALIIYPFIVEPLFSITSQSIYWFYIFIFFYILIIVSGILITLKKAGKRVKEKSSVNNHPVLNLHKNEYINWTILSSIPTIAVLAFTNHITKIIAPIPLLWLLPLCLYLITYIIAFSHFRINQKLILIIQLYFILFTLIILLIPGINIILQILILLGLLFTLCLLCHEKLYQKRPHHKFLTNYYFMISFGGMLGTFFISFIAPLIFKGYWEFILVVFISFLLVLVFFGLNKKYAILLVTSLIGILVMIGSYFPNQERNFYGIVKLINRNIGNNNQSVRLLASGRIIHGAQYASGKNRLKPNMYFSENSGIGLTLINHPNRLKNKPLKVGIIGLGVGEIAAYCRPGDYFHFYELNPNMVKYALKYFTYLESCGKYAKISIGDGRLMMQKEKVNDNNKYDIIIADAFTDDSIPTHLLTKNALKLYLEHLDNNNGIIAYNITNSYIDYKPLMKSLANWSDLHAYEILLSENKNKQDLFAVSDWIIMVKKPQVLAKIKDKVKINDLPSIKTVSIWTDNYSDVISLVKLSQ